MQPAGANTGTLPSKGTNHGGQRQTEQQRQAAPQQQNSVQALTHAPEEGDGHGFMPVRGRRARRKQRQQLQQSLEAPYPTSGADTAVPATAAELGMGEADALLQPVPEAQSDLLLLEEEAVGGDAAPASTEAGEHTLSAASLSSNAAVPDGSRTEEVGSLPRSSHNAEKTKMMAVAAELAGSVRELGRGSTRGKCNMRGKKPMYELRRLYVPAHRLTPLRKQWVMLIEPLVTHLQLQVRMNVHRRCIELRRNPSRTVSGEKSGDAPEESSSLLQKGSDYVRAFLLGFAVRDALALLRLDDLSIESFEVRDVKRLAGEHLSRCLARLSGRDGKTKFAIENATRTRLVFADSKIHILGSFENIRLARHACCSLILGAPPGKVYNHLRTVTRRLAERF